ncbi:RDD family protein [Streptomyces sp. B6B3]|uniref:RDD family protein n=1 Tax=Streptomyces sp. B6B3 TaxID=3153570 RepID=UPI00325C60B3
MSQLVTGDAVVLGLQPARLPSRALAITLDLVVLVGCYLLLVIVLLSAVLPLGTATAAAVQAALLVLFLVGGPVAVETLSHGRSLGKLVCGLRVVREDGGPIRFRHALVRGAIGFLEILATVGCVACIASLVSARGRRLGDVFAGTLVVRERIPGARSAPPPPPPPGLDGRFAELDLSRVPEGLWLAVRQYLGRMRQLDQRVAWSMAVRLCSDLVDRIGTPAPPGIHPVAYLAGVAAERQRRDAERAFGPHAVPPSAPPTAYDSPHQPSAGPWQAPDPAPVAASTGNGPHQPSAGPWQAPDPAPVAASGGVGQPQTSASAWQPLDPAPATGSGGGADGGWQPGAASGGPRQTGESEGPPATGFTPPF